MSTNRSRLTELKDRGPYIHPSEEVIKLCLGTEKVIRSYENQLFSQKNITKAMTIRVLRMVGIPFNTAIMDEHILSQENMDNHRIQLTKLVIECYIKIRVYHIAKLKSQQDNLRQKLNRLVIFKGR